MSEVLTPEVIEGVRRHMNGEHRDDALRIVRGLSNLANAQSASLADLTPDAAVFEAMVDDTPTRVAIAWERPIVERMDIRLDIVRMHTQACEALGIEPPSGDGEH